MGNKDRPGERDEWRQAAEGQARAEADRRIQQAAEMVDPNTREVAFKDGAQRDILLRVQGPRPEDIPDAQPGASLETRHFFQLRAYDAAKANAPDAPKGAGRAGEANLILEVSRDVDGQTTGRRLRVSDYEVPPAYQGEGIGGALLEEIKAIGRQHHAQEIYGPFAPGENMEAVARHTYEKHGFQFRPGAYGGEEAWLALPQDEAVRALQRELR